MILRLFIFYSIDHNIIHPSHSNTLLMGDYPFLRVNLLIRRLRRVNIRVRNAFFSHVLSVYFYSSTRYNVFDDTYSFNLQVTLNKRNSNFSIQSTTRLNFLKNKESSLECYPGIWTESSSNVLVLQLSILHS